jgi:hypothetical protein
MNLNVITDKRLAMVIATKRSETIEQESIPVICKAIQTELWKVLKENGRE